jgi:hypothetical protein
MSMLDNLVRVRLRRAKGHKAGCSKLSNKLGFILGSKEPLPVKSCWHFMDKKGWFSRLFKHDLWPIE